jgi:murein DD-endopeptidase MepM/ murein hydrolase activator NlpD
MRGGSVAENEPVRPRSRGRLAVAMRATGVAALLAVGGLLASAVPAAAHGPADSADGTASEEPPMHGDAEDAGDADGADDAGDADAELLDEELEALAEEIEELRHEAAVTSRLHETLRREEAGQRAELVRLGERLSRQRHQLHALRAMIGRQASSQYRAGGAGAVSLMQLMLAETPEDFLNGASLIGRGELSARQLMERAHQAEQSLHADERRTAQLRAGTAELVAQQDELRTEVEAKLEEAEGRLEELEEAKAAAEKAAAEKAAKDAARGAAEAGAGAAPGECVVSVRDSEALAEPAIEEEWTAPLEEYRLSAGYGSSGDHWANGHTGQDFAVPEGTDVLAIGSGTVVATGCADAYGHQVVIDHENGYFSQYAHLSVIEVEPGQEVGAGQRIALSGNTGNSTGPHLHFEIRLTPYVGSAIDPMPWLSDHGVQL